MSWWIKDRKIKVAVLGLGRISKYHLDAIAQHQDLQLVGVSDSREPILAEISQQYHVNPYTTLTEMLEHCDADLVSICTPSGLHPIQTIEAAKAGCHVLTEKPMATHWQDGLDMVKACNQAHVRLFVVKQNRLNPTMQQLKQAIVSGRFGRIYMVAMNIFWSRTQEYYDNDAWRMKGIDGGAFMNQASHYIDMAHWLIGPVESVQGMMATLARHIEAEDSGVLNLRWRNGALGTVAVTMLTYPDNFEGSITIIGEKGLVRVGGVALNEVKEWQFSEMRPEDAKIKELSYQTDSVYGFGHPLYYDNVIKTFQGKEEPLVDGQEGLASLELLIAAYRAARDGITVHLPLEL